MLALFQLKSPLLRAIGQTWDTPLGTIVETTTQRAVASAKLLGLRSVIVEGSEGMTWEVITDRRDPHYGTSYPVKPIERPTTPGSLVESVAESSVILKKLDSAFVPLPGAILEGAIFGLDRALTIIAESETPEAAEEKEWETRDGEETEETGESDPALWEDAGENFELDDQDWEALLSIRDGDPIDLTDNQRAFLEEAGMIEAGDTKLTEFGSEWLEEMSNDDREDQLVIEDAEVADDSV